MATLDNGTYTISSNENYLSCPGSQGDASLSADNTSSALIWSVQATNANNGYQITWTNESGGNPLLLDGFPAEGNIAQVVNTGFSTDFWISGDDDSLEFASWNDGGNINPSGFYLSIGTDNRPTLSANATRQKWTFNRRASKGRDPI